MIRKHRRANVAIVVAMLVLTAPSFAAETSSAVGEMIAKVEIGDTGVLIPLGFAYLNGDGVDADLDRGVDLFRQAAAADVEGARSAMIAAAYAKQKSGDLEGAVALFQEIADNGEPAALVPLAYAYQNGNGVSQDPAKGAELFEEAVDGGVADALVPLGFAYLSGNGVSEDKNRAVELFGQAVDAKVEGAGGALIAAAYAIQREDDPAAKIRAFGVFEQALRAGVDSAYVPIGYAYQTGTGVDKDAAAAAEAFQDAVDADIADAYIPLGFAYSSGNGVEKDLGRATELFSEAIDAGVKEGAGALVAAAYAYQSEGTSEGLSKSVDVFQMAVDAGEPKGLLGLAFASQAGKGVRQDKAKSIDLFAQAAAAGVPEAPVLLFYSDANAYVRLLQTALVEKKFLEASANGLATQATIRAFNSYCASVEMTAICRKGPLSPDVISAVSPLIWPSQDGSEI